MTKTSFPSANAFNKSYLQSKAVADSFDGMMNNLSYAIFEALLTFQRVSGVAGNCAEYGVYRGRSASVILKHLSQGERAVLVDVKDTYPQLDRLREINPSFEFICSKSEDLEKSDEHRRLLSTGIRFSHHDASHTYNNVAAEMSMMEPHLIPKSIMVLDDFNNPCYLQVVAACYKRLSEPDCNLELFLYSDNKAYLCHRSDFDFYAGFVLDQILPIFNEIGLNVQIARSDVNDSYRAFSLIRKRKPDDGDHYGTQFLPPSMYQVG